MLKLTFLQPKCNITIIITMIFLTIMPVFWHNFSLAELGVPPSPLTENHPAQKPLAERGGTPPPLNGQNPLKRF